MGRHPGLAASARIREVVRQGRHYVLAFNPEAAERDRQARQEVVARLKPPCIRHSARYEGVGAGEPGNTF